MNIDGVKNGIVLDHIKAGKSMMVYELLGLDKLSSCVAVIQNADSAKYGKKDIIKIDDRIDIDLDVLGYIDSNITVNLVKDGQLEKKLHLELPQTLRNVISARTRAVSPLSSRRSSTPSASQTAAKRHIAASTATRSTG